MRRLATLGFVVAAAALALTAQQPLSITTTSLPPAIYGQQYPPVTLNTSGDPGPFQWSIVPVTNYGPPPPGFVVGSGPNSLTQGTFCYGFNNQNGSATCSGNVQAPLGSYTFMVRVFSYTTEQSAQQMYTLQVVQPLQFVTGSPLPTATANTFYSKQLQIAGGTTGQDGAQFTWSVIAGSLPAGITLDANTGLLSGPVSNAAVPSTFTVQVTDLQANVSIARDFAIDVVGNIAITTSSVPNATLGQQYPPFQFEAVNLPPGYIWSVLTTTPLPAPFSLSSSGLLTGSGGATGIFPFTVLLTNALTSSASLPAVSRNFILYVTLRPLGIREATLAPGATQNIPYTASLTAVGGLPPYAWSFAILNPQGLTINPSTGAISGTPPNAGTFTIPVTLRDAAGGVFSKSFPFNVGPALSITTTSLPNGALNVFYSATPAATGGATPCCHWELSGTLPPGLSLNPVNGQISGTPTTEGTFPFTLKATDSFGTTATKALTIVIGHMLAIVTSSLPDGSVTQSYVQTLAAANGTPNYTWSIASGTLPAGLQLNGATGVIRGTPTSAGTFTFDVLVTDATQAVARRTLTIRIQLLISPDTLSGTALTAFSQTVTATGGTPPYTWSSGALPAGLQLHSATGLVDGTPGVAGTSQVAFSVSDANGLTGTRTIAITISQPPPPAATIGVGTTTQPAVSLTTGAPYASDITGVITLTFVSSAGGTDGGEARFSDGTRSLQYTVPATKQAAIFTGTPAIVTGTVAGTITLTVSMSAGGQDITPSPAPTKTITIDPAVPVISSVTLQQVTGGINVVVTGYSNTRELSSGSFTFTAV